MDSLEYECPTCRGSLISKKDLVIQLMETCERCGGTGKVDWIGNVISSPLKTNKGNPTVDRGAAMSNIQVLQNLIIEEGARVGVHVIMNMEFKDLNEYLMRAASPMMIKGGRINVPY